MLLIKYITVNGVLNRLKEKLVYFMFAEMTTTHHYTQIKTSKNIVSIAYFFMLYKVAMLGHALVIF